MASSFIIKGSICTSFTQLECSSG